MNDFQKILGFLIATIGILQKDVIMVQVGYGAWILGKLNDVNDKITVDKKEEE